MESVYTDIAEKLLYVYNRFSADDKEIIYPDLPGHTTKPDSIGYGSLGWHLFALELYRYTGEQQILADVSRDLHALELYTLHNKSNNYSLLNGRSGLPYLYLQLYRITKEQSWLDKCTGIVKKHWDKDAGNLKIFDNKGIVNGLSGLILFYLDLYTEIREEWLMTHITQCTMDLINKANMGESEVYWPYDFFEDDQETVWMSDRSAIALCCLELGWYSGNNVLLALAKGVLSRERNRKAGIVASANRGSIGDMLVDMHAAALNIVPVAAEEHKVAALPELLLSEDIPGNLYYGLAGHALGFREAYNISGNPDWLQAAKRIAATLEEKLTQMVSGVTDKRFFTGIAGIGYALLKMADKSASPSLMLPRVHIREDSPLSGGSLMHANVQIDQPTVNRMLVQKNYKETLNLLKKHFQPETDTFLLQEPPLYPSQLQDFVATLKKARPDTDNWELLQEMLERERAGNRLKELQGRPVDDDILYGQRVDKVFQISRSKLLSLRLVVSDRFFILKREPVIDLTEKVSAAVLQELLTEYGSLSYFMRIDNFNQVQIQRLDIRRLYVDQFITPATVNDVAAMIISFVEQQDEENINMLIAGLEVENLDAVKEVLKERFLEAMQWLLAIGLLEESPAAS
ncbi:lanthionine synthetase LanC family protein [Chitinophaga sp. RAB17]|uniref:lanthionine synthetase LanC family protein n=1 Tax=Chitinophaga sp. RAB17 TaxID=3233049 RepID=UPI003F936B36